MITVEIYECSGDGNTYTSKHRTDDPEVAINRAITKHYGGRCALYESRELSIHNTKYGYIGYYLSKAGCAAMVIGRVRVSYTDR